MGFLYTVLIVGGIGLVLAIVLSLASKFFAVPTDEKVEKIRECLPGANCGACGYSGCDGYAEALATGAEPNLCTPGGAATADALSKVLGVEIDVDEKIAVVHCHHSLDKATSSFAYSGVASCAAVGLMYGGPLDCKYGCLGFGDCIKVCDFGALSLVDGNIVVDKEKCGGCGKCAKACPKGIISIESANAPYYVACSNKDKGAIARKFCSAACIGCGKCAKVCTAGAITVTDNLAFIDPDKCTGCGECEKNCPTKAIISK